MFEHSKNERIVYWSSLAALPPLFRDIPFFLARVCCLGGGVECELGVSKSMAHDVIVC